MPGQPDPGAPSGRDMRWPQGLRGSAPGRRLGPAGHRGWQPLCRGQLGLLAELGGRGTSGTSAGGDAVPAPPQHCRCRTRPRCHTAPGMLVYRRGQGSWQGMGSAPGTEESRPLLTHPTRDVSGSRGCPQLPGASCRTMAVGLDWALPYPVLHFPRCSAEVPAGCHPPGTKPAELSSCGNGGSPAHCPAWFAAG